MTALHRPFTLILPYYENPGMLVRQYDHLSAFPADVRKSLHLIVCDDGSPKQPAAPPSLEREIIAGPPIDGFATNAAGDIKAPLGVASFQLFRVDVDVRWNWLTCRNIGVEHAKTQWVLMTDIDHLIPERTARRIIEGRLREDSVYRFARVDAPDMKPTIGKHGENKPHPNTWLMTKGTFNRVGGYDERFSGFYGSDGEFRDRVRGAVGMDRIVILPEPMIRVPREVVPDASTTTYGRKERQDATGIARARARIAKEGGPPKRLSFPYHRVV